MYNIFKIRNAIVILTVATFVFGCENEEVPAITTSAISNITATSATSGGNITSEGSSTVVNLGVCWSTGTTPTIADKKTTDGAGAGSFTSNITGLDGGLIYYVRAYATNSAGTGYGMAMSFTSLGQSPAPTISDATNITTSTAKLNGTVNANYLSTDVTFEYGTTTSYGNNVTATQSPLTGNTNSIVSANISGLNAGTTYHCRIKSVNSLGTTYSSDITFLTLGQSPTATTLAATNITTVAARLNGTANANFLSTIITFEYGTTANYGNSVTASQSPLTGSTITNVNAAISGLTSGITYHYRIKAVNSLGTAYGNDWTFTLSSYGRVTDVDGNTYDTVAIGTQVWMKQNLKTRKYSNGDAIPTTNPATLDIGLETSPKYQWAYNGIESNADIYGRLYTWYAVTDMRNICPTGWHVPSDAEWTTLRNYLGGASVAGGKLKETGTSHWNSTSSRVTNESGFTAFGAGNRHGESDGFINLNRNTFFWSSTQSKGWELYTGDDISFSNSSYPLQSGFSVRCLRDF